MLTATPIKKPATQGNGEISCGKIGDETDEWETVSEDSDIEESKFTHTEETGTTVGLIIVLLCK